MCFINVFFTKIMDGQRENYIKKTYLECLGKDRVVALRTSPLETAKE